MREFYILVIYETRETLERSCQEIFLARSFSSGVLLYGMSLLYGVAALPILARSP